MATDSNTILRDFHTLFHFGTTGAQSDSELLGHFLAQRGENAEIAFAAVVARHGPMVLRVCRRILTDPLDAEDAFQVTFLVLARKARSIARRDSLANWLYGVAVRTAREVRTNAARRRKREGEMKERVRGNDLVDGPDDELRSVLDEELSRLPETFRAAVVLCDLEDKTHSEAARIIGVPVGTVSSRLVRGRRLLRTRLARRGLDPSAADPKGDRSAIVVPPALIDATSRAAAPFAMNGTLAGTVPAYLAWLTQSVLKAMLAAKLTSKGVLFSATLFCSLAAVAAGGVALALRGAAAGSFAFSIAGDSDLAWVDGLQNADQATRERLKRCAGSAMSNFASLHRLEFEYDLKNETPDLPLDASGKLKRTERGFSHGTVYWKDGIVRYDHFPVGKFAPDGRKLVYKRPWVQSVVRSREMFACTAQDRTWGLFLTVTKPPSSVEEWQAGGHNQLRYLDPLLHYAEPFCQDVSQFRQFAGSCRAIESEEKAGTVLLRFLRADNNFRVEVSCEEATDWLPTRLRSGQMRDGKWLVALELEREWQKISAVWYPIHQVKVSYFGVDSKPVREIDLTVGNLRANGRANLPDSVFTLNGMNIPDGTPGLDKRHERGQWLTRAGGVVRQPRPGEGRAPRNIEQEKTESQKDEETVPEDESAGTARRTDLGDSRGAVRAPAPQREYAILLLEYETARQAGEKAHAEAKSEPDRREAYLALGRLEWSNAPRFLEIARKYPRDPAAIDALGGLVANTFTPPEANEAADILIRDHLGSEKMMPIYDQLVVTLYPAPASAAERLLRAAEEKAPTAAARGVACIKLAQLFKYRADAVRKMRGPEPDPFMKLEDLARSGGQEPAKQSDDDPDALMREAERFYDRVVKRYADIQSKHGKLGERAAKVLFQIRELAVGRPAPEIEGPDVNGTNFRLSDYRGKVVVLSFSSNWGGSTAYAYQRGLVERMKGKPFAMLSVNIDDDAETVRKSLAAGEITWRCWWEGGAVRPNCERWRQEWFPMVYVLDAQGIIRAKDISRREIDVIVDRLVNELAAVSNDRPTRSTN
jgi:RNA polymerase sigma factor (sigma-70 family)